MNVRIEPTLAALALFGLDACSSQTENQEQQIALSEHAKQPTRGVVQDMLATTYPESELQQAGTCIGTIADSVQLLTLIEAPRNQARAVLESLHNSIAAKACIASWRSIG